MQTTPGAEKVSASDRDICMFFPLFSLELNLLFVEVHSFDNRYSCRLCEGMLEDRFAYD